MLEMRVREELQFFRGRLERFVLFAQLSLQLSDLCSLLSSLCNWVICALQRLHLFSEGVIAS